jgi:hypothetical protein
LQDLNPKFELIHHSTAVRRPGQDILMLGVRRAVIARRGTGLLLNRRAESSFVAPVPINDQDAAGKLEKVERPTELELLEEQAPNRAETWAPSQRPRRDAFNHPRFEKTALERQVGLLFWTYLIWISRVRWLPSG